MLSSDFWDRSIAVVVEELSNAEHTESIDAIAERLSQRLGQKISRKAIASALSQRGYPRPSSLRAGLCSAPTPRATPAADGNATGGHACSAGCMHINPPADTDTRGPGVETILVCPDVHAPYHDARAFDCFCRVVDTLKPDALVIIGDFVDCYSVSRFSKSPERASFLSVELDEANKLLDRFAAVKRVVYCEGNHEVRLTDYVARQARELHGMISIQDALRIQKRGWQWVPYKSSIRIGRMHFTHDVDKWGKHAAQQSLEVYGGNLCIGHTHRAANVYWGNARGEDYVCLNVGWLGDVEKVDYRHRDRARIESQHGFGLVRQEPDGTSHSHFIPILDGRAVVDGRIIA